MTQIDLAYFTAPEERALAAQLDPERVPRHVAVIMDGNGRWATRQGLPRAMGHAAGVESVRSLVNTARAVGIAEVTVFGFSTENWSRPTGEVNALMLLIEQKMREEMRGLHAAHVRIRHLGRRVGLPATLQRVLDDAEAMTRENAALSLQFAINYSGRAEIVDAVRRLAAQAVAGTIAPEAIEEEDLSRAMYAPDLPDPDLLIRTAGEMRVSNYLLWEIAYSEYWSTPVLWPDFRAAHLLHALHDFQQRQRKFGRVPS